MALRAAYAGRANEGTLVAASAHGRLYIVYASGRDVVVYAEDGRLVQLLSDPRICDSITHLAASSSGGRLAAVCGARVVVLDPAPYGQERDGGLQVPEARWAYAAHADVEAAADGLEISACAWLGEDRLVLGVGSMLHLLECAGGSWAESRLWGSGSRVDAIAPAPTATKAGAGCPVFATVSLECRLVKVWQLAADRIRFQYVVHSDPVCDVCWRRGQDAGLVLYAITRGGGLYMWHADPLSDSARPPEAQHGIRFAMTGMLQLARHDSQGTRRLVAAGVKQHTETVTSDGDSDMTRPSDSVYAVYSDGSLDVWSEEEEDKEPLVLRDIWDGHREPIFHISTDPYSRRTATHSTEGELLIWDAVDSARGPLSISRKVALGGGQIRIIAWAPVKDEFIAATGERVCRLVYSADTEQWEPRGAGLPSMEPYDRVFTYPADADGAPCVYYISAVAMGARRIQTWAVGGPDDPIRLVGTTTLAQRFDRVARVMPVPHPFFSHDNIMATFDTGSGKLRIWGVRAEPEHRWFCSKEHRIPCLNVDMIRYNSIDKAAIVSTDASGVQTVTVWVFSSASRKSHYLPAGTIYPRRSSDRVREVRWHLAKYAQTYLGIQWDDHIDIYCQERNVDGGWLCAHTISASEFGPDMSIGSFSFTAAGDPTFSLGKQLRVHSQVLPGGRTLGNLAYDEHGQLPLVHPFVLTELMSWGKTEVVKRLIAMLYDYIQEVSGSGSQSVPLPLVSMRELLAADADADAGGPQQQQQQQQQPSRYAALLGAGLDGDALTMDADQPDFGRFSREKAEFVAEKLTEVKIRGLSPIDQARLLSIVGTISASQTKDQPIDSMGVRYLVKLQLLELENKRTQSGGELPYRELNWALHSRSQAILLQICLQRHAATGLTWESARRMGVCVWLSDVGALRAEVESLARNTFVSQGRDPSKCAIFYLALRKQRLLHGLWRTAHGHPEQAKMLAFLANDFGEARWRTAAAKNAYVLLSRQRHLDAATFFMLSGKLADAATVCITQLRDMQLAVAICRCYEGDAGPVLKALLWRHVLPDALRTQDRWLASLAFGLVHRYDLVLQALADDLSRLGGQLGIEAEASGYSAMNVLDTELLILYRSMLDYSPSSYRAPLVVQAELIAQTITIFECLGAPVMSLVVLEWWRRELFAVTKRAISSSAPPPAAAAAAAAAPPPVDSASSGVLDMSAFAAFPGLGAARPAPTAAAAAAAAAAAPAADPLASGMLSMDSFGSMFSGMALGGAPAQKRPCGSAAPPGRTAPAACPGPQRRADPAPETAAAAGDDGSLLAVEIEDTPVQRACRVALALQIAEFFVRSPAPGIDVAEEKRIVAEALRLPGSVFPAPAASSDAAQLEPTR
ncbi:regulator of (H+)-ATPase in vacuolar membrane [Coemansia javaensis]|uniref:Regulator of (H+)-ATPase in vacuolar membrane n=1 Tax=Coemansia javaensis TaxID=2761396 RepID=A0A9W8HHM0_9FUNG|nr:regulator of (H+)-ATPase in vacuolar membrane [Coemansia javaensis]